MYANKCDLSVMCCCIFNLYSYLLLPNLTFLKYTFHTLKKKVHCPKHLPRKASWRHAPQMLEPSYLAPPIQRSSGVPQSLSWMPELRTPSLRLNPDTLWRKHSSAAWICNLFFFCHYPQLLVSVGT